MTKQSRSLFWPIGSLTLAMVIWAGSAQAQDTYTPPPMFDAPAMNAQVGENVLRRFEEPRRSTYQQPQAPAQAPEKKYTGTNNPLLPPVVTHGDPALEKATPATKPNAPSEPKRIGTAKPPIPTPKPQIAQPALAVIETPQAPAAAQKPAAPAIAKTDIMPAARVTSKGVVTGPKTMPSVPTTHVVAERTFDEETVMETIEAPTLMERHHATSLDSDIPAAPEPVIESALPAAPANKLSVSFAQGMSEAQDISALEGIIAALHADPAARLMIEAYGTSMDQGENSDRRLSLARAMTIRKAVLNEGIAPHRIDIRALGRHSQHGSPDRADLSVYKS